MVPGFIGGKFQVNYLAALLIYKGYQCIDIVCYIDTPNKFCLNSFSLQGWGEKELRQNLWLKIGQLNNYVKIYLTFLRASVPPCLRQVNRQVNR
ncbi:MAG: hypothetical protein A2338_09420 [Bacteroidetes bacterium RIFOXYB12_FULL_41_6]|nr:MAG: hypothetical protein A2338_09420 [Bacteroidetes bacterium RIFOXYB12_FULL_41_6]